MALAVPAYALPLASVNGVDISEDMFRQAIQALGAHGAVVAENGELREKYLQHLIDIELKAQAALKEDVHKSQAFEFRLIQAKKQILANMLEENWLHEQTNQAALKKYFLEKQEMFVREEVKVSHILVKNRSDADRILAELLKNKSKFEEFVRLYSIAHVHKTSKTGAIEWFSKGTHLLSFEEAAFTTSKGELFPHVVSTDLGYHILRVDDVRYYKNKKFVDLQDEVKMVRKRSIQNQLALRLKSQSKIQVNNGALRSFKR